VPTESFGSIHYLSSLGPTYREKEDAPTLFFSGARVSGTREIQLIKERIFFYSSSSSIMKVTAEPCRKGADTDRFLAP
jgi:hypothetical protein